MQNIFLSAATMLTHAPSPTPSTSGAEPWPARFAGRRLGVLSHWAEGEAGMAWGVREMSSTKKEEVSEFVNERKLQKTVARGQRIRHFVCVSTPST